MKVALAQLNFVVGDVAGNSAKVRESIASAASRGADLVAFSELSLVGYPPRDLLLDGDLIARNVAALEAIAKDCRDVAALVGFVRPAAGGSGPPLEDGCALLADGQIQRVHVKSLLPNYDVYDDPRYFRPGDGPRCAALGDWRFGVTICEDVWDAAALGRDLYGIDPIERLAREKVGQIVNVSASGYERGKVIRREALLARQARRSGAGILYVNQVGGNDGMIFDGGSCAVSAEGELIARAASFREDILLVDTRGAPARREPLEDEWTRLARALELGVRDYVAKGGYDGAVVALGCDAASAVTAALAAAAVGADNVHAVAVQTSAEAAGEVRRLAEAIGVKLTVVAAEAAAAAMGELLRRASGHEAAARDELSACLRAVVAAMLAAGGRRLVLVGASKTDLALGRRPAAVSESGALAPLGDLFRRDVLRLAEHVGACGRAIPRELLDRWRRRPAERVRAGGAELCLDDALDEVLSYTIEEGRTASPATGGGHDAERVRRVVRAVEKAEWKRRQAPTVLQVSPRAFGLGRRMPVARAYA